MLERDFTQRLISSKRTLPVLLTIIILLTAKEKRLREVKQLAQVGFRARSPNFVFSPSHLKEQECLLEICLSFSESFPGEAQNPQPAHPLSHALGCPAESAKVAKERRSCI